MQPETLITIVGMVLASVFLYFSLRNLKKKRTIDDTPTSKANGVFIGLVEVSGSVECENPLRSYISERDCVYYSWSISEHWSETKTETYTDSQGNTKTRTKRESGWKTVASGKEGCPFDLRDETGVVQIRPEKAKIEGMNTVNYVCGRSDPLYYGKGPAGSVLHSDHRRRFSETLIPLGCNLYVIGQSRERLDTVAPEIAHDPESSIFVISTRDERKVSRSYGLVYYTLALAGFFLTLASIFIAGKMSPFSISVPVSSYLVIAGSYLAVWFAGWFWTVYNGLKSLRERVKQGKSQIEVQLKRRNDLVPRLASCVTGLMNHEQKMQTGVASLRSNALENPAEAASRLLLIVERYPGLKSSEAVSQLQRELADSENRIELARRYYNDLVTFYNTRLERIPDTLVAKLAGLRVEKLFAS